MSERAYTVELVKSPSEAGARGAAVKEKGIKIESIVIYRDRVWKVTSISLFNMLHVVDFDGVGLKTTLDPRVVYVHKNPK
ncbi:MAG: hypothetical protein WC880_05110 [Candidatus Paceibacterota bacterium]